MRLQPLAQTPDAAFLVLELNKVTPTYAIKNKTQFIGPKDEEGDITLYESIRETVLNPAKIKYLHGLYYGDDSDNIGTQINSGRLFAAPIINSADGQGEELGNETISWHPFHIKEYAYGELSNINMPQAEVGFAISSHYLRLREGVREITLTLSLNKSLTLNDTDYRAYVTTEKEWLELESVTTVHPSGFTNQMRFILSIPADKDPVTAYNKEVHLGSLGTTEPVLKIILNHNEGESYLYDSLSSTLIYTAKLKVKVGDINGSYNERGIKDLELHNDASPLNPSKPFHPWGAEPRVGNSFIIGSDEIFYKRGARLQLNLNWKEFPSDTGKVDFDIYSEVTYNKTGTVYEPYTRILKLSSNIWEELESSTYLFYTPETVREIDLSSSVHDKLFVDRDKPWIAYNSKSKHGFLKIQLNHDFGHRDYYSALQSYFITNDESLTAPFYPYSPILQSISISYEASCMYNLWTTLTDIYERRPMDFFHIGPFGDSERHRVLQGPVPKLLSPLVSKTGSTYTAQGSLFIGLEGLEPGDTQSVLFQVQEGSEDPLLEKPENHLNWEYLKSNNSWQVFDKEGVGDNTSGLLESGLINFIIPKDAALEHTAFESGLIWIRCFVTEAPGAVAKIIGIFPNAIKVQRQILPGKEYTSMLTRARAIKKLLIPDAKIKIIEQPYASFEGKPKENSQAFYLRASERLRNKDRAINIWDCERLVLQSFPEMYKVKCLNHTKITGSLAEGDLVYNEVAPGHISVITIPNLANRNDTDPLRPYTKKSTLKNICEFLKKRSSCQVSIHTAQPDFEEVKVKCNITLRSEYPDITYYTEVIQNEITNFLSPWAFASDADLNFGGRIHQSVLIDFIEELPYVDFLTDFELHHIKSDGSTSLVDEAIASTARSILVSVPAIRHELFVTLPAPESLVVIECPDE